VKNQRFAAIDKLVRRFFHNIDPAEILAHVIAQEFIMIAGDVNDARALADLAQQLLNDDVMGRRPVPYAFKPPTIDNVADKKNRFGIIMFEQAQQLFGLATAGSEMNVRDEQRFHMFDGF